MKKNLKFDFYIPIFLFIFAVISLLTIGSAQELVGDETLVFKQLIWYVIGSILIIFMMKMKNHFFYKHIWLFYIIGNILLFGLFFVDPINNARCWYQIPGIGTFQPSEFMKIILILLISHLAVDFSNKFNKPSIKDEFMFLVKVGLVLLLPSILTFLQPDTGVVLIYLLIAVTILFITGIRYRWFLIAIGIVSVVVLFIVSIYFIDTDLFINLFGTDFFLRIDRLLEWSSSSGYQLENGITSIGSAGLLGNGIGNNLIYFPEAQTDFIFAVLASNFGFILTSLFLVLLIIFDLRLVRLANNSEKVMNKLVISGIIGMLIYQQFQNIGMTLGILPITGITLPFISYGGSSLLSYMIMMGFVLNISMDKEKYKKSYWM